VHHTTPTRANFKIFKEENVASNEKNVAPNEKNVAPNEKIVTSPYICKKCNKIYKIKKSLIGHETKCKGVDELTCPRCMISFTTRQHKSRHITNNKCKPRSIIHARIPNAENITNNINSQNIETQNNINTQNNNNNTIIVNNYGSERMDYLDYDKMLEIFKSAYNIPSILTKHIHFNKDFPENNNITCSNDDKNYSLVKMNDEYIFKNLNSLVYELIKDKTRLMHNFATGNKENICVSMDTRIYEDIIELLLKLLLLQEPSEQYKHQVGIIRDMIKNSNVLCKVD
jgi:uncharacterized C2H2 Zn-finger protein